MHRGCARQPQIGVLAHIDLSTFRWAAAFAYDGGRPGGDEVTPEGVGRVIGAPVRHACVAARHPMRSWCSRQSMQTQPPLAGYKQARGRACVHEANMLSQAHEGVRPE
jgi:hypothetical protein